MGLDDKTQPLTPVIEARGRLIDRSPVSVIDIGSNSVRLVVYEGRTRSPTPLFNEKVMCGLGRSVAETGKLDPAAAKRALDALQRFTAISHRLGSGKPWALATAAIREATDGDGFLADVERVCGVKVLVLSGAKEAELAAAGVLSAFHDPLGVVGDLGGGSLELLSIGAKGSEEGNIDEAVTRKLGGLRLMQRSGGDLAKAAAHIEADLASVDWLKGHAGEAFYAVGGTWRAIGKMHMDTANYPLHVTHGYRVDAKTMARFCKRLIEYKKGDDVPGLSGVTAGRRDLIPLGALVLLKIIEAAKPENIIFSIYGIREGLLFKLLPVAERRKDPLLAFCEDWAKLRARSPDHARELCDWTGKLFQPPGPKETPGEQRLRHAACLMSDVNWRTQPDYRGEQSLGLIAHAGLGGLDHAERVFVALAVFFRHAGINAEGGAGPLLKLIDRKELARAKAVGAAIRAAHMLSVGTAGVIGRTRVRYEGKKLIIEVPEDLAVLKGERLTRRMAVLGECLGFTTELRFGN